MTVSQRTESSFGFGTRSVLIVAFTGVETAALAVWLALVREAPTVSTMAAAGLAVLFVGLVVEHVLTAGAVNGPPLSLPGFRVLAFSASETVLWALWLVVAEQVGGLTGVAVAGVVLAVLLVPQHTIEDNVLRGRGLLAGLFGAGTIGFSIVEAAGATAWLALVFEESLLADLLDTAGLDVAVPVDPALVGLGLLAVALLVEHVVGVRFSRR